MASHYYWVFERVHWPKPGLYQGQEQQTVLVDELQDLLKATLDSTHIEQPHLAVSAPAKSQRGFGRDSIPSKLIFVSTFDGVNLHRVSLCKLFGLTFVFFWVHFFFALIPMSISNSF